MGLNPNPVRISRSLLRPIRELHVGNRHLTMIPYSHSRWIALLVSPSGSLTRGVLTRVFIFGLLAAAACLADAFVTPMHLPVGPHEIVGAIIALALAFRSNTAYSRFWEARTLWGAIVNTSRNLRRLLVCHATLSESEADALARWIVVLAHSIRRRLRHESIEPEARRLLAPDAAMACIEAPHPSLFVAQVLSRAIADLRTRALLDPLLAQFAEGQVADLIDRLGGCERIHRTPTPIGYVLLLRQLSVVFLATLPFVLVDRVGIFTPFLVMTTAYPVLMIEGLGNELDDPFGHDPNDLPLTRICETIETDLLGGTPPPRTQFAGVGLPVD
jgi:ion channel-forming bestrophin family protein